METLRLRVSEDESKDDHFVEEMLAMVPTHLVRGGQDQNTVADPFPVANSKGERFPGTSEVERCEHSTREAENREPKPAATCLDLDDAEKKFHS